MSKPINGLQYKRFFYETLRFKTLFVMAFMVAGVALVSGIYFSLNAKRLVFDFAVDKIETLVDTFSFNVEYGLLLKDTDILSKVSKGIAFQDSIPVAMVLDPNGEILVTSPKDVDKETRAQVRSFFYAMAHKDDFIVKVNLQKYGEAYLLSDPVFTEPKNKSAELGLFGDEGEGAREVIGYVAVFFTPAKINAKIIKIQAGIVILLSAFSLAVMIFIYIISGLFIERLRILGEAMRKIREGDLSMRVQTIAADEMGDVCQGFNEMSDALEKTTVSRDLLAKEVEERKKIEEALRGSEEKNRMIIETANDAFISIDSAGRIKEWNRKAETIFGWKRKEVTGRDLAEVIVPLPLRQAHSQAIKKYLATGEASILNRRVEFMALHKDGHEFPIEVTAWPLEIGNSVDFNAFIQDITERKRLEQMILQSEKMSAIGQLAGGVAHEINNPLGVILGFAQNVVKRIQPGDPYELPLKSIEREAVRCKNLVQDLLTFSRASKTEKEPIDVKEAIESALSLVVAQAKVKNVELVREFPELPLVVANKNQIQQVVVNLSNNAIDAMPEGGKLILRLLKTTMAGREGVEIQVQDTGQGIPEGIRSKIFNPFFTTKEIGKGTGLGLSLVHEIVGKHEGTIYLESEVGKGTTFHVFLPLAPSKE